MIRTFSSFSYSVLSGFKPKLKKGQRVQISPAFTQDFTVQVPYTVIVNGQPVTKLRPETKTRTVPTKYMRNIVNSDGTPVEVWTRYWLTYKAAHLVCFDVNGNAISAAAIKDRLKNPAPVIMIEDASHISPFFAFALKPNSILWAKPKKAGITTNRTPPFIFEGESLPPSESTGDEN